MCARVIASTGQTKRAAGEKHSAVLKDSEDMMWLRRSKASVFRLVVDPTASHQSLAMYASKPKLLDVAFLQLINILMKH